MINGQKEIWIKVQDSNRHTAIIAVSNCGRVMLANGKTEFCNYRKQRITTQAGRIQLSRFLLNIFKPKTEDDIIKCRIFADHITHNPENYCVNDIRNLRWCTNKENANFEEAHENQRNAALSESSFGKMFFEKYNMSYRDNKSFYNKKWYRYKVYGEQP